MRLETSGRALEVQRGRQLFEPKEASSEIRKVPGGLNAYL